MKVFPVLGISTILALSSLANSQTSLRLKLPTGKTYRYGMQMKMAAGMTPAVDQSMDYIVKVLGKTGDNYRIQMRMANVKMSSGGNTGATAEAKKTIEKTVINGTYTGRGTQVAMSVSGGPGSQQIATAMGAMNYGFMGLEFPVAPVRVGTTWSVKMDMKKLLASSMGQVPAQVKIDASPLNIRYTVKSVAGNAVTIATSYSGSMSMSASSPQGGGAQTIKMNITGTGTSVIDPATGMQRSSVMNVGYAVTSPMQITQKMTMTLKLK